MKPLISVIIPIYKTEKYLKQCINSVCNQTYKNLEIILINDDSPDNSGKICEQFASKDNRIKVIHKKNEGLSEARNTGLKLAQGDYISFIDSDDFIDLKMYDYLLLSLKENPDCAISSCMFYKYFNGQQSIYMDKWTIHDNRKIYYHEFAEKTLLTDISFTVTNKIFKKDILKGCYFRKGRVNEDTLFMFDISPKIENSKSNIIEIPHRLYFYRFREDSICNNQDKPLSIEVMRNYKEMITYYQGINNNLSYKLQIYHNNILIKFLEECLKIDQWEDKYFPIYYKESASIPFSYYKSIKRKKNKLKFIFLKISPFIFKIALKQLHKFSL